MMNNNNNSPKRKLRKMLSGFLAVSTAVTMLGGNTAFFADETALATTPSQEKEAARTSRSISVMTRIRRSISM